MNPFRRVCLIGLDRTVGSFALGLKRTGFKGSVVAVADPNASSEAWKLGIITGGGPDMSERLAGADLVMLSASVRPGDERLANVLEGADENALVCETSRLKVEMHRTLQACVRKDINLVGLHVLASAETTTDVSGAVKFYFDGKTVVLAPRGASDETAAQRLQAVLEEMGSKVVSMTPEMHDRWLGLTTQLPGIAGLALLKSFIDSPIRLRVSPDAWGPRLGEEIRNLATALRGGWVEDVENNREALLASIDMLAQHLQDIRQTLNAGTLMPLCQDVLTQATPADAGEPAVDNSMSLMVVAGGDNKMLERAASVLAVARIPVDCVQKVPGTAAGTYRLTLKSVEERIQAINALRRAGIGIVELS